MGCCAGVPYIPCDIQSAKPFELPEIITASCCVYHSYTEGISVSLIDTCDKSQNSGAYFFTLVLEPKFKSPPIYLQKLSLLI
jgi:hypothetical protein